MSNQPIPYPDDQTILRALCMYGLILDTNTANLFLVGSININLIGKNGEPRVSNFSKEDFLALKACVSKAPKSKVIITPHTVSEIVHLLGVEPARKKSESIKNKADYTEITIRALQEWCEIYTPTSEIIMKNSTKEIKDFGIVDLSLKSAFNSTPSQRELLVTNDGGLAQYLTMNGYPATTLAHVRVLYEYNGSF